LARDDEKVFNDLLLAARDKVPVQAAEFFDRFWVLLSAATNLAIQQWV
jgi:hypothetical protein